MSNPTIWPIVLYKDCPAAIKFLEEAFGFTTVMTVPDESNPSIVVHAQLEGPSGGGIMVSSAVEDGDNPFRVRPTGAASVYVVTDAPDELHDQAMAAGAKLFAPLADEEYGSRGFSVTDLEDNVWSFGTYGGEST